MESENFRQGKRTFFYLVFLSACLWLLPFLIRICFIDIGDIEPLQKKESPQEINVVAKITHRMNEGNKLNSFGLIFWNNLKICVLNIVGGVTLGVATTISLLKNGFFFGDVIVSVYNNGMPISSILKHTLPHSIEIIGTWQSSAMGFSFTKIIIDYMRGKDLPNMNFIKFLGYNSIVVLIIILIAAYIEVYISMSI